MLYKKYHRNFVSQFKKGAKVVLDCLEFVVDSSPFITTGYRHSNLPVTVIAVSISRLPVGDMCKCGCMDLVYFNGKLRPLCHVI